MPSDDHADSKPKPKPIPNSYWVEPGRLLAGEYPGALSRADAMARVRQFIEAGITSFVDLTEEEEMPPYHGLLPAVAEQRIEHRRLSIRDHDVPESPRIASRIVDAIEAELSAGRTVYVHCRAGIGRTGTIIACYLIRRGRSPEEALEHLHALWQDCARSRHWPAVPETDAQQRFVREWSDTPSVAAIPSNRPLDISSRATGAFVGLALGDALGTKMPNGSGDAAVACARIEQGIDQLVPGLDTATTLCAAQSLLACGVHDSRDQLQRYAQWMRTADTATVAMSPEFKRAVAVWQWSKKATGGTHDPRNLDPHTLARSLAAAVFMHPDPGAAIETAVEISRTTHQSPVVLDACRFWTALLIDALSGVDKATLLKCRGPAAQQLSTRSLKPQVTALLQGRWRQPDGEGSAISVVAAAMCALSSAPSFREGILQVLSTPRATTTAGALYGSLAGAHFGIDAIAPTWQEALLNLAELREVAQELAR